MSLLTCGTNIDGAIGVLRSRPLVSESDAGTFIQFYAHNDIFASFKTLRELSSALRNISRSSDLISAFWMRTRCIGET
ncbi:hypothetical protein K443DRAFT_684135 [Laccaria amethystina LaAM-08-1]|uniref:Uncharacterized protein n=1 Tax=Laccaria amethystina LaAM-08-1 TaxID=1095629 RepID=A0A0C9XCK8_9AGAR|nr:hypothetical protein K443DRAFT_684135 [Laccaria amethystina LaAM-08-1]